MAISHVATPTNHDLAQEVQISLDNKWSGVVVSVLIHKSVEDYMGPTSLFVERSGSAICLIL